MRVSEYLDEPAHARSRIYASAILTVFYIVRRSSMTCVLLYLNMFSCIKPNLYTGKEQANSETLCLPSLYACL